MVRRLTIAPPARSTAITSSNTGRATATTRSRNMAVFDAPMRDERPPTSTYAFTRGTLTPARHRRAGPLHRQPVAPPPVDAADHLLHAIAETGELDRGLRRGVAADAV